MSLMEAVKIEQDHRAKQYSMNEALMETLPDDPPRGSYYWWVKLCRQNTGTHFLDSGMAYGYRYNSPYKPEEADPITIQFWDAKEAAAYINLPHFLTELFETDEMYDLVKDGISIIMVSSELPELLAICDRFVVLASGKIQDEFDKRKQTPYTKDFVCPLCEGLETFLGDQK